MITLIEYSQLRNLPAVREVCEQQEEEYPNRHLLTKALHKDGAIVAVSA